MTPPDRDLPKPDSPGVLAGRLVVLLALATAIRLAILRHATTDGSDSIARVWGAWRWLADPHWITHGVWGPLHTYLIAPVLAVFPDPVGPPILLHVAFGVAAVVLMYCFTRVEFGSGRAAFLVALTFAVYPIAIRNSVSVRSEAPFVLFLLAAMVCIALVRKSHRPRLNTVAAGVFMTLAGMLRYEAWLLIPLFAPLLWRTRWLAVLFVAVAIIHPVMWMVGNAAEYGDPFYSTNWATNWELNQMGRSAVGLGQHLRDARGFLLVTFQGMTLLAGLASLAGAVIAIGKRRPGMIWLLPLIGLTGALSAAVARGSLVPKFNYTVTLGVLLLPFSAVLYRRLGIDSAAPYRYALGCAAMVASVLGFSSARVQIMAHLPTIVGMSPTPAIDNEDAALRTAGILRENLQGADAGLISDFFGWGTTHYVALQTRLHPDRIYLAPGAPNQEVDRDKLTGFVGRFPHGVILLQSGSRFANAVGFDPAGTVSIGGQTLRLAKIASVPWPAAGAATADTPATRSLDLFRYAVAPGGR